MFWNLLHWFCDRLNWANNLTKIGQLKSDLNNIDRKRNDLSNLAPQEQEAFQHRLSVQKELSSMLNKLAGDIGKFNERKGQLLREISPKQSTLNQLKKDLVGARSAQDKVGLGQKLQNALGSYRKKLKLRRKEEIETAINLRFKELMTSHELINHIQVNDDFSFHYLDAQKELMGMGNLSAGMKQLVAQSLLWGLKDISGREAPVVIDTPLARIDRKHQENLISRYYPKAGRQVIILPTDSEIDQDKYALIKPNVYREFRLDNQVGDRTVITPGGYF